MHKCIEEQLPSYCYYNCDGTMNVLMYFVSRGATYLLVLLTVFSSCQCLVALVVFKMACNRDITFEEFLDQKPPIEELIEQIDAENEWLMFGVILGLTKDAIYQLPRGIITGKTVAFLELWLNTPYASRRQLLLELRKDPDKWDVADNYERHLNDTYQAEC